MLNKELNKKTVIIILIAILILQTIVYVCVGLSKSYIHIDEGYSYGLINYDKVEITANEDFYDTWHDSKYYSDYLTISNDEKDNWRPVYEQQKKDVHPPFYYFLLRVATSFNIDNFSIWPGIILNIIIHIGITIFTYLIASKLFNSKIYGLGIALVGGLTIASLETIILTRMYALTALSILVITYLHIINLEKEKLNIKNLIIIGICAVLGSLTHYYYLVFLFILYAFFLIRYIVKKQYKNAINYTICMVIAGIVSLLIFPYSFVHMFMGYRGQGMLSHFANLEEVWRGIGGYLGLGLLDIFNGTSIIILVAIIGILIYDFAKKKEITFRRKNKYIGLVLLPTLIYFGVIAMGSPYIEIRYLMPIAPLIFILIIYAFKITLQRIFKEKTIEIILAVLSVIMLIIPIITQWNITYLYPDMKEMVAEIKEKHAIPALYIFNKDCNRFMDDLYLFTKFDESYIMDSKLANEEEIRKVLAGKDIQNGIILFINSNQENDDLISKILIGTTLEKCEYMKRLNACDVYYLY